MVETEWFGMGDGLGCVLGVVCVLGMVCVCGGDGVCLLGVRGVCVCVCVCVCLLGMVCVGWVGGRIRVEMDGNKKECEDEWLEWTSLVCVRI